VNRGGASMAGVRGYGSVADIPDEIDLAVICVPRTQVLESAAVCLARGIRGLCVITAGFAEVGEGGSEYQRQLLELVRAHGGRLIGPNCLGVAAAGARLNATFARRSIPFGRVGFSSQGGPLGLALSSA